MRFTLSIGYDPIIGGLDRYLVPCQAYKHLSLSSWRLALELVNNHTKGLTVPENEGKVYEVTVTGLEVHVTEVTHD